jgi:hypothetical protein
MELLLKQTEELKKKHTVQDECYSFSNVLPPHLSALWRAASEQYRGHAGLVLLSSVVIVES